MTTSSSKETLRQSSDAKTRTYFSSFPMNSTLETVEQIRRFELLRLAFFVLKLRKIEQRTLIAQTDNSYPGQAQGPHPSALPPSVPTPPGEELEFRCNLLRHVIFQQVLTLIQLDAREQAMHIIYTCHK